MSELKTAENINDVVAEAFVDGFTTHAKPYFELMAKKIAEHAEILEIARERIESLETFCLVTWIDFYSKIHGSHPGQEKCKVTAEMLNIDWDKMVSEAGIEI